MILQANLQAWRRATTGLCRSHNYPRRPVLLVRANQQYFPFTSTRQRLQQLEANGAKLDIPATSKLEKEQTAMLYLDNIFPLRINVFDIRQWFFRDTEKCLETRARGALLDKGEIGHDFTIKHLEARIKDGGAVVTFGFRSTDENKRQVAKEIVSKISDNLRRKRVVASFNFQPIRAFFVKGEPFFEDILNRYPSLRLRVEFQGEPVSIEKLYKHFRPYGRIYDISVYPNPLVSKDPARYAIVQFTRIRSATSARNCLHGHTIHGCRMNILYERQLSERTNWIKDWIVGHPRISVPIIAALVAGLTYAVFDPIRVFFIVSNVTQRFNPESYGIYQWFRRETWARIVPSSNRSTVDHQNFWQDDHEDIEKVKSWMNETPETFVLISGPKGSGKSALVKAAIQDRRNALFIDCEELANTRNQSDMITTLAKQVGYFPIFTWISSISNVLETAVVASTGQKGGFTSSPETQIRKILEAVAVAVGQVNSKEKAREARSQGKSQSFIDSIKHWFDLHLQNPKEKKHSGTGNEKDAMRADIPVIIIDNFMYRETPQNQMLWNELADFAALLVENEVAHVVFISSNVGVQKVLSRALPGKSFETIALSDAPPEVAMSLISRQLGKEYVDEDLHQIVIDLGGRLTELELLIQKLKMNMDPQAAFEDIVQRNVVEIRKYGFKEAVETDEKYNPQWTAIQFWEIVKGLASSKSLNFDELKWGPFFKGDEKPLREMERAELITILQKDGRPNSIRPGKPVFYTVFDRLVSDSVFSASMEIETNNYLKKIADDTITKLEDTVGSLSRIYNGKPPKEIERRIKYLLKKIASNQEAIEAYEQRIQEAKRVVASSWEDCGS